jgi:glutaminyl-tRNA synthetase
VKDGKTGEITELHCSYDPKTRGGDSPDGRKVKATLHWVSARHALRAEARLYANLFLTAEPGAESGDFRDDINPDSLEVLDPIYTEPGIAGALPGSRYQFERMGYFCVDPDSSRDKLVFNRTVTLKDTWAKIQKTQK